ncbi:MAG: CDP-alcohol phosphatidyltransferase [Methyloceanibacter sp.]|nr:MAG: CDP-alcohol phosphatidyltransferase [Methyloceanibacter sp.]
MATIYDLKPSFQALLRPIAGRFVRGGVTANAVTLAALALSLVQGASIALLPEARWPLLLLPLTLFVRMALNAIDGLMAKEHGQKTVRGAVLNELSDVISDAVLYLPLALIAGVSAPLVVLVVVSSVIAEFAGVLGPAIGASRRYDGPFGKSDRAFAFGSTAALLGLGLAPGSWTAVVLAGMLALSAITIWNRARKAMAETKT